MAKVRKRRRLLRVVIASGLLVVAVPSVATAHEHLGPVDALLRGRHAGSATDKGACSVDPRDPQLMKPGAQLCSDDQFTAGQVRAGQERAYALRARAYAQHLVPPEGTERIDQGPAPSDGTEIEIWWGILGIVVAAGGVAGLIVALRRGRPHALS
jgi:hypothetical protein